MKLTKKKMIARLKQYGYKLTPQRREIIEAITSSQERLTPNAVYERIHQDHPNIGFITVYRTLGILAKLKLICELHTTGNCASYTISASEPHHHLICSNCGKVVDFSGYDVTKLEQKLAQETKFEIKEYLLEFIGLCQACQKETV